MGCQQSQIKQQQNPVLEGAESSVPATDKKIIRPQKIKGRIQANKIYENIRKLKNAHTQSDLDLIQNIISKHFLLFKLSKNQRRSLASAMEAYQTDFGQYVFQQGTPASMFFIINSGEVQIEINNASVGTMKRGDSFGELAIIYTSPRSASVRVLQQASFWCLSQHQFLKIQREMVKNNFKISQPYVNRLPLFQFLTDKQKISISYNFNTLKYCQNEIIFKANDDAISFFIIIEGVIEISIAGKAPITLKSGDSFGENCLTLNQKRSGTAKCKQKSQLLAISRQDLKSCICVKSQFQLLFHNKIKWALRRSNLFIGLTNSEQHEFIASGQIMLKKDGQVLIAKGQNDDSIYISLEQKINKYQIGQIINEVEIIQEQTQFQTRQTLTKQGDGHVFAIKLKKVYPILYKERKKLSKITQKTDDDKKSEFQTLQSAKSHLVIDFKDLFIQRTLGEGEMGKVLLVQNKRTLKKYALKCVPKNVVIKNQLEKFIRCEKQIIEMCDFPLIVKLFHSFKDTHFIYFLMEYIDGGDFFDLLNDIGTCSSTSARFYIGCLLLCIQYLHKNNIIYRDIKPQNAAVDKKGYLHMIDMGTAKLLTSPAETGFRTFTIVGTPHYMAPEVMQAKGYSFSADIWSLGIILYQMIFRKLPFGNSSESALVVYQQIQKNEINFPKSYTDPSGKQLIKRLLQKHPDRRAVEDFSQIKNMQYFFKFNWKQLQSQKMTAPVTPRHIQPPNKSRNQYLLSYLKKQKLKMEKPLPSSNSGWDDVF